MRARCEYDDWKNFGERVRNERLKTGLSKEKFAELINRSENYVTELEKGNSTCSLHTLYQICNALHISSDLLLYGEGKCIMKEVYDKKEILYNILDKCNVDEISLITDLVLALYPKLNEISKNRN